MIFVVWVLALAITCPPICFGWYEMLFDSQLLRERMPRRISQFGILLLCFYEPSTKISAFNWRIIALTKVERQRRRQKVEEKFFDDFKKKNLKLILDFIPEAIFP
jgi:hypothetical protein